MFKPDDPVSRGESVTFPKRYNDNIVKQTVGQLSCNSGQVAAFIGGGWGCADDQTVPDTNTDALGARTCTTDQIARCSSVTCSTHDASVTLDNFGNVGIGSSIAIGTDNLPIISYVGSPNNDFVVVRCGDKTCASADSPIAQPVGSFLNGNTALAIASRRQAGPEPWRWSQ